MDSTSISNNMVPPDIVRLVPHSGIQFLTFRFNLGTSVRLTRGFIGRRRLDRREEDGTVPMELLPGWNEDDPDGEPPFEALGEDDDYTVTKEKAVETFTGHWIPVPFLGVRPGFDVQGQEILETGPLNWARVKISPADPSQAIFTHHIVFAFDTEVLEKTAVGYVAPTPDDVRNEREYSFAYRFRDVSRFLRGIDPEDTSGTSPLSWVDRWLLEIYLSSRANKLGRRLRDEEKKTVEHLAQYITLLEFISTAIPRLPRIRLIDTYAEDRRTKPVAVDLVLDLGNSRTCGVLIETYPNDQQARLDNAMILELRDLEMPFRLYREPFESRVELAQAHFGPEHLSRQTRVRSFFWPSPVRIGPEATRYRDQASGSEASSGVSSPKRYLCDVAPVNQEWRFQPHDYDSSGNPPTIDVAMRRFMNPAGDVARQVSEEPKLYAEMAQSTGYSDKLDKMALQQLTYSRSSMFTLMLAEIITQTMSMINNPQVRSFRKDRDAPRELRRIILSIPTAMPIQEQRIMRSRALAAVKLVWDLMRWTQSPPPSVRDQPRVSISWDEATCTQMVYLFNEIVHKAGGQIEAFFDLVGKKRKRIDPDKPPADEAALPQERSLRIASVDIGGGTTDLMITTYYIDGGRSLTPIQNFREGFRIAGDEVLREVIQQAVLPAIENTLRIAGVGDPHGMLAALFASNTANMSIQEQHTRQQFVLRVLEPAALAILKNAETAFIEHDTRTYAVTLHEILAGKVGTKDTLGQIAAETQKSGTVALQNILPDRIRHYLEDMAEALGARGFNLEECSIPMNAAQVRNAVATALSSVFDCVSEAVNVLDCDIVILSGRPSRLPATIDLFVDKLAVTPDRVVPLSQYQVGKWYPFAATSSFRIEDPKTATVVGSLLCVLVERQFTNFRVDTNRFNMRSTAKYLGELDRNGCIKTNRVIFSWKNGDGKLDAAETATIQYWAQMKLGYRQLELERWIATPLYRLKQKEGGSIERLKPPFDITFGRKQADEDVDFGDRKFSENEALKESLAIREVQVRDGGATAGVARMFTLQLETLTTDDGYWLDTGILTVA